MDLDKRLTYYLAGPMSGVPQFNIPLFDNATARLRLQGFTIVSPAELDDADVRKACLASVDGKATPATNGGGTWAEFLARDVKLIADKVDGIVMLPDWVKSRGARLEVFVGLLSKKSFGWYNIFTEEASFILTHYVREQLIRNMP